MKDKFSSGVLNDRGREIAISLGLDDLAEIYSDTKSKQDVIEFRAVKNIRMIDAEKAREFILRYFGKNVGEQSDYFPNGTELGEFINYLGKIRLFSPDLRYSVEELRSYVKKVEEEFNLPKISEVKLTSDVKQAFAARLDFSNDMLLPFRFKLVSTRNDKTFLDSVISAGDYAWFTMKAKSKTTAASWNIGDYKFQCSQSDAAYTSQCIVMQKVIGKNPFNSLMEIYSLGLWPVGTNQNKEFVIWQP